MNEHGFFMMEAIWGSLLLTVLVAIVGLYMLGSQLVYSTENLATATCLAEKQLACVRGNSAMWRSGVEGSIPWQDTADTLPLVKNGTQFAVATTLENMPEQSGLKRVIVGVSWQEYHLPKRIELSAMGLAHE